jgi:hypothetical protein
MLAILLSAAASLRAVQHQEVEGQMPIDDTRIADRVAVAEEGKHRAERRLDQHQ